MTTIRLLHACDAGLELMFSLEHLDPAPYSTAQLDLRMMILILQVLVFNVLLPDCMFHPGLTGTAQIFLALLGRRISILAQLRLAFNAALVIIH